ncbi:MAG TPA: glycosyltransferase family 4 protein [Candidatus Kapabacteria bacterium]|nr:glycosyltransferase family 4 protein [Candidatus Kapabacteria bacterium]
MPQPDGRLHLLLASTALYPFVQDDIDMLRRHFPVDVYIGSGVGGAWQNFRRALRADVSISWFGSVYTWFMVMGARLGGGGSIVLLGGVDVAKEPELGYGIWRSRWKGMLLGHALRKADHVFAVDPSLRATLERSSGRTWEKVATLPTGYDAAYWMPGDARSRSVLCVAACNSLDRARVKGIDLLIDAAGAMPDVTFRVIGVDDATQTALGAVPQNMALLPPVPRDALRAEYRAAAVYCQPSRREGLPNALCEAMLCACVPVGTKVGGIPTAIGDTGGLVEAGNVAALRGALLRALDAGPDAGLRARARIAATFTKERRENILIETIQRAGGAKAID